MVELVEIETEFGEHSSPSPGLALPSRKTDGLEMLDLRKIPDPDLNAAAAKVWGIWQALSEGDEVCHETSVPVVGPRGQGSTLWPHTCRRFA